MNNNFNYIIGILFPLSESFLYIQIHFTQAFADQVYNWRTENKINITCFWVGPFTAFVVI